MKELHREPVSETARHHVGHQEGAAARILDPFQLLIQLGPHRRFVQRPGKLLPEGAGAGIGELEDLSAGDPLCQKGELFPGGEDRGILPLHEPGKGLLHQPDRRRRGMAGQALLGMGKGNLIRVERGSQRRSGGSARLTAPLLEMIQKCRDITRLGRLRKGTGRDRSAMVVGSTEPDFFPWFVMGGLQSRE